MKKSNPKDKMENKNQGNVIPATQIIFDKIDALKDNNTIKIEMILNYLKELTIGQTIKKGESLTYVLCGKKWTINIIDITPNAELVCIDQNTQFKLQDQQLQVKNQQQLSQIEQQQLMYYDHLFNEIQQIIEQNIGEQSNEISLMNLPLIKGVLISGLTGTGKTTILQILRDKYVEYKPVLISINHLDANNKELQQLLEISQQRNNLILIDDLSSLTDDNMQNVKPSLFKIFDNIQNKKSLIIATITSIKDIPDNLRRSGRFEKEIIIDQPNHEKRVDIMTNEFMKQNIEIEKEILKEISYQMSGFTVNDIRCLVREFYLLKNIQGDNKIKLRQSLQKLNPSGIRDLLADVPKVQWDDIGGYEDIKQEIKKVVEWPLKYPEQFKKLGITPSKGILLYGPPGCSKTLLARALCTQCNLAFIAVKGPEIFSKYVGDSEKTVREIFKKARICAPSVLFFDEIDAIAPQRQGSTDVSDRVLIQLLTEIDGFESLKNVIIIAATNRPASIDKALLRPGRFDHLVFVDVPDRDGRKAIFEVNLKKMKVNEDVTQGLQNLIDKTIGYTGAEICQICREAGLNALNRNIDNEFIELKDFEMALQKVKPNVTHEDRYQFLQFAKLAQ
ncbi:unnamed protein product [Paramecium primaurelia]|uniref:AAA+ ATPase domain-containing protein n=1 Tax=Paramecium primaurelia TaxID=5886 RepID=A0A8S1Q6J7_PARPR|nr:unnamed protein product [Paramecium primaurelia]